jgi:hypothetical protein
MWRVFAIRACNAENSRLAGILAGTNPLKDIENLTFLC